MPLQLNPLELGPLAAAAANKVGFLGLRPYPVDVGADEKARYEATVKKAELKLNYDKLANDILSTKMQESGATERQQMQDQGAMQRQQLVTQAQQQQNAITNLLAEKKFQAEGMIDQAKLGIEEQKLGIDQQQLQGTQQYQQGMLQNDAMRTQAQIENYKAQQQAARLEAFAGLEKEKQDRIGAFAAAGLMRLDMVKDNPQEYEAVKQRLIEKAQKQGLVSPEEAKQAQGWGYSQTRDFLLENMTVASLGQEYKRQQAATKDVDTEEPNAVTEKVYIDKLKKYGEQAAVSRNINDKLVAMEQLDKSENMPEGSFANIEVAGKKGAAAIGQMFGINIDPKTADPEAFNAIAKDLQLDYQTKLKGATSDRDMNTVAQALPQLTNTKDGRALMYNWGQAMNTAIVQQAEFMESWAAKHKGNLDGASDAWDRFIQSADRFNAKTNRFDIKAYGRESWNAFLDKNYKTPERPETQEPVAASAPGKASERDSLINQVLEANKAKGQELSREQAALRVDRYLQSR